MPRDDSFTPDDPILDTLLAARTKFTGPESWFKNGHSPIKGANYSNCIGTAIKWDSAASNYLMELATGKPKQGHFIASWNNAPSECVAFPNEHRTYEDVIELLDRAIATRRAIALELVA